jgi:hypothetical protein
LKKHLIAALLASLVSSPLAAATPYELRLGMGKSAVTDMLGSQILTKKAEITAESSETWVGQDFHLYFCDDRLAAIAIELRPSLTAWVRAVESEIQARGPGRVRLHSTGMGSVALVWPVEDQGELTIEATEFNEHTVQAMRWLSSRKICPKK